MSSHFNQASLFHGKADYHTLQEAFLKPENGFTDIYWIDASFIEKLRPE